MSPVRVRVSLPAPTSPSGICRSRILTLPHHRDKRASAPATGRRPLGTTDQSQVRLIDLSALPARCSRLTRRADTRSLGPPGDSGDDPCRRQGDQVVARRARQGAGCRLRTTMAPLAGRRYRAAGLRRRASAARRSLTGRACPDGRSGGRGDRSATLRTIKRRSTVAAGVRSLSLALAVVGTGPHGALAARPERA